MGSRPPTQRIRQQQAEFIQWRATLQFEFELQLSAMKPTIGSALIFGSAAFLGALIWLQSPILTGESEPWESFYLYSFALFLAGFLPAFFLHSDLGLQQWVLGLVKWQRRILLCIRPSHLALACGRWVCSSFVCFRF